MWNWWFILLAGSSRRSWNRVLCPSFRRVICRYWVAAFFHPVLQCDWYREIQILVKKWELDKHQVVLVSCFWFSSLVLDRDWTMKIWHISFLITFLLGKCMISYFVSYILNYSFSAVLVLTVSSWPYNCFLIVERICFLVL